MRTFGGVGVVPGFYPFQGEEFEEAFDGGRGDGSGSFLRGGGGISGGSQRDLAGAGDDDFIATAALFGGGGTESDNNARELAGLEFKGQAGGLSAEEDGGGQEWERPPRYG